MIINSVALAQKIEFKSLENNPGILPFKLGNAHVQLSQHTFIHNIPLYRLEVEVRACIDYFKNIEEAASNDTTISYLSYLPNNRAVTFAQLRKLINSFNLIKPSVNITLTRNKRGLINGLGHAFKFLFGNLDSDDGEKIELALKELQEKQDNIIQSFNRHLSINKQAIQAVEANLKVLTKNQQQLAAAVGNLRNETAKLGKFARIQLALNILDTSMFYLQEVLDNIQISLTFANLNVLHPAILNNDEINFMLSSLSQIHDPKTYYSNDYQSFLNTVSINYYITNEHIVFALHVPLLHPDTFQYYKLYSIPTTHNTTIISPTSYVAISGNLCEYISQPCKQINRNYHCSQEAIIVNHQEEQCISHLLQVKENPRCIAVPVSFNQPIVEQINEAKYIIISPRKIRIKAKCKFEEIKSLQGIYLVHVPYQCMFTAKDFTYVNLEEEISHEPVYLPTFDMPTAPLQPIQLNLKKVPLDQLHKLTLQREIPIQPRIGDVWMHSSIPLYVIVIAISALAVTCYYCRRNRTPSNRDSGIELQEMNNERPCTFFTPKASV